MFVISKLSNPACLQNNTLRDRAIRSRCDRSQEFVAVANGEEVGLLSYEDWSDRASAFVYEIFVLPSFRRRGLGSALLSYAEELAVQLNCEQIRLKPHALADEPDLSRLRAWYARQGYGEVAGDQEHMVKTLVRRGAA